MLGLFLSFKRQNGLMIPMNQHLLSKRFFQVLIFFLYLCTLSLSSIRKALKEKTPRKWEADNIGGKYSSCQDKVAWEGVTREHDSS